MPLPGSGSISLNDIQNEFGGSNPISISEYYNNGSFVRSLGAAPNVPTSGQIAFSNFYGSTRYVATTQTVAFTGSTTWTVPASFIGTLEVLVVGGGGAGGGAGGVAYHSGLYVSPGQTYTVTIGGGGGRGSGDPKLVYNYFSPSPTSPPGFVVPNIDIYGNFLGYLWRIYVYQRTSAGSSGTNSSFDGPAGTLTGFGGGCTGTNGGSSGGNGGSSPTRGSGGTANYGNAGGVNQGVGGANAQIAGGGGGAGGAGRNGAASGSGGYGGDGITLMGYTVAGGGGAGGYRSLGGYPFPGSGSLGGSGIGGNAGYLAGDRNSGVYEYADGFNGVTNRGGGGGGIASGEVIYGEGAGTLAGNGGSGLIVVKGTW